MFSFIKQDELVPNTWTMHQLMRKSLMDHQEEIILLKVRTALFDYYNEQLKNLETDNITDKQKGYFVEAYYHGKMVLKIHKFAQWFSTISNMFYIDHSLILWNFMIPFIQDILSLIGKELAEGNPDAGAALNNLNSIGTVVEDMNFDGFNDVRIQAFFPPGPNIPYYYYMWDNSSSKFAANEDMERIPSPEFDHENKTIRSFTRDNAVTHYEDIFKYVNGIPTLVQQTKWVADPEKDLLHITIKELNDGEMQIVDEYEERMSE